MTEKYSESEGNFNVPLPFTFLLCALTLSVGFLGGIFCGIQSPKWVQSPVSGDAVIVQFETKAFTDSEFTIPTEYIAPMSHLNVIANEGGRLFVSFDGRSVWIRWNSFEMATIPKIPKVKP